VNRSSFGRIRLFEVVLIPCWQNRRLGTWVAGSIAEDFDFVVVDIARPR
jgi:hypothetical protein